MLNGKRVSCKKITKEFHSFSTSMLEYQKFKAFLQNFVPLVNLSRLIIFFLCMPCKKKIL